MSQEQMGKLGRLCEGCGAPLRREAPRCPYCGFDSSLPAELQWGLLTVFGYGVCGFVAGAAVGLVTALVIGGSYLQQTTVLIPLALGVLACLLAAGLGKRLAPGVRCAYEHFLLACDVAGVFGVAAALLMSGAFEAILLVWAATMVVSYWLLRRYGYRRGG